MPAQLGALSPPYGTRKVPAGGIGFRPGWPGNAFLGLAGSERPGRLRGQGPSSRPGNMRQVWGNMGLIVPFELTWVITECSPPPQPWWEGIHPQAFGGSEPSGEFSIEILIFPSNRPEA